MICDTYFKACTISFYKIHTRNGLSMTKQCYLSSEMDIVLLRQLMDKQQISSVKIPHFLGAQIKLQKRHPWEQQTISSLSTSQFIACSYPLTKQSNAQVWMKKIHNTLWERMHVSAHTSPLWRGKNKQQMLVMLLNALLEGIQIYSD